MSDPPPPLKHTRFARIRARLEAYEPRPGWPSWLYEFLLFGFKQGWACLFGALMLALLLGAHLFYPDNAPLARNDFVTLAAIAIQIGMLAFRLENWEEARVILAFHVTGTIMEQFKTQAGSWNYPGGGVLHIGLVPLYSGFMYAAVGSYIARVWRIFGFRFAPYPPRWMTIALAATIYVNFGRRFTRDFSVIILRRLRAGFSAAGLELKALQGRRIRVRGWLEQRRGPVMDVAAPEQIEVIE